MSITIRNKGTRNGIIVLLAFAFTVFMLGNIVTEPWHTITNVSGDGGKNNFTFLYHVLFGKGVWFKGMNYPYGEHVTYADAQPLLSVPLSYIGKYCTVSGLLTLMWWAVVLSYILGFYYLVKLFSFFKVDFWLALVGAALIIEMNPQLGRLGGHYGLSYVSFVPALFYFTYLYNLHGAYRYIIYLVIVGLVHAFLHPYYAAVFLIWVSFYSFGYFVSVRASIRNKIKHLIPVMSTAVLLFGIIALFMRATDPCTDRPITPWGTLNHTTTLKDLFTAPVSTIWHFLLEKHWVTEHIMEVGEGNCYAGFAALMAFPISVYFAFRARKKGIELPQNGYQIWWIVGGLALLLAMGVPFVWHMQWLLDYVSFLKQFRTLGRFAWVFYYIITIYAVVSFQSILVFFKGRSKFGSALVAFLLGIWCFEAYGYRRVINIVATNGKWEFDHAFKPEDGGLKKLLADHHLSRDSFQAALVLPYFSNGSEKLWVNCNNDLGAWVSTNALEIGLTLNLPLFDAAMSRTSWKVAFNEVRFNAGPYCEKQPLTMLIDKRPVLLSVVDGGELNPDQSFMLKACDSIGRYKNAVYYIFHPEKALANDRQFVDSVNQLVEKCSIGDTCLYSTNSWVVNHFDGYPHRLALFGRGAAPFQEESGKELFSYSVQPADCKQLYEFSVWFKLGSQDYKSPSVHIECYNKSGAKLKELDALTKESVDIENMWFRDFAWFTIPDSCVTVKGFLYPNDPISYFAMDEMMLRPANAIIVSKSENGKMVNNHIFPPIKTH